MYAALRRISRFASEEELREVLEVLRTGGVVAVPVTGGYTLVARGGSEANLEALARSPSAQVLPEIANLTSAGVVPKRLNRWFRCLLKAGIGELVIPNPSLPQEPQAGAQSRRGVIARMLGIRHEKESATDRATTTQDSEFEPDQFLPPPTITVRLADNQVLRSLCRLFGEPLVAATPRLTDGDLPVARDLARRYRDQLSLILSIANLDTTGTVTRGVMLRTGMATRPDLSIDPACQPHRPLFVCIGNLNRSAFAEAWLRAEMEREANLCQRLGWGFCPAYQPTSAGMIAVPGASSPREMIAASAGYGAEGHLQRHHARRYHPTLAASCDEIMPLDRTVADEIRQFESTDAEFTFAPDQNLPDPMGGSPQDYGNAAEVIDNYMRRTFLMRGVRLEDVQ